MAVGDRQESPYRLRGALPAGAYTIHAGGYQPGGDARLHADLVWHPMNGPDKVLLSLDSPPPIADAGAPGLTGTFQLEAVASQCGDELILKIQLVSGKSGFIEFSATLAIP